MLRTPSKINLFLKVTGRCDNSYHTLRTFFAPLCEPADEIKIDFNSESGISINCDTPGVPCDERNLCYKAASKYAKFCGLEPSWEITLHKNIPVAAGMGGGSSDAAAVLRLLNDEYKKLSGSELSSIALECGADVPFFLNPRPALAAGVGEVFEYPEINFPEIPLLLINPKFPISAAWAYKNLSPNIIGKLDSGFESKFLDALSKADLKKLASLIHNDLAVAAYEKFPLLLILKHRLLDCGAVAAEISGSGPTMFALCENFAKRDELFADFQKIYPQMNIIRSSTHISEATFASHVGARTD
jgi:4-diphosphocytidyl-2-C-methyl-D-erythritol kinase